MIVTKMTTTIYRVELTQEQRSHLFLLLETCKREGREFIAIQEAQGKEVADDVRETCDDLLQSL